MTLTGLIFLIAMAGLCASYSQDDVTGGIVNMIEDSYQSFGDFLNIFWKFLKIHVSLFTVGGYKFASTTRPMF